MECYRGEDLSTYATRGYEFYGRDGKYMVVLLGKIWQGWLMRLGGSGGDGGFMTDSLRE